MPEGGVSQTNRPDGFSASYALKSESVSPEVLSGNMRVLHGCNSGLAWAARKEVLQRGGFYDACIMGSGDRAMLCGALGLPEQAIQYLRMNPQWEEHYVRWAEQHYESVGGEVRDIEGSLYHLWHGDLKKRQYQERHIRMEEYDFTPQEDLRLEETLCWGWNSNKPEMHQFVEQYFTTRQEDEIIGKAVEV
jgi:hypothetical protein